MRILLLALVSFLLVPNQASALELEAVIQRVTVAPPATVGFREERYNEMFAEPMRLTGYLEYFEDGRLRKVVETPFEEALLVHQDHVEIVRDGETRILSLSRSRSLRTMLDGIKSILTGDTQQLLTVFDYKLSGDVADWSLNLAPKSKRVARQLKGILVRGNAEAVTSIRFELHRGEHHTMEIEHGRVDE